MNVNKIIEIFNHTLITGDCTQLLSIATPLQCFRSATLGCEDLIVGSESPSAFREAVISFIRMEKNAKLMIEQKIGDDRCAVYIIRVITGKTKSPKRALTIGLSGANLISFVETGS